MKSKKKPRKSTWNYRVLAHENPPFDTYIQIHEVYYTNAKPNGYTKEAVSVGGYSKRELLKVLTMMRHDVINKPILCAGKKFPKEYKAKKKLSK